MYCQTDPAQEILEAENNSHNFERRPGSTNTFTVIPACSSSYNRPLMTDIWTQTDDIYILNKPVLRDIKSQREKELEDKVKSLEENLRVRKELLSKIHATSAKTSLLSQEQTHTKQASEFNSNTCINHSNLINSRGNSGLTQLSPVVLTVANATQQLSSPVLHNTLAKTTLFSQEQPQIQQAGEFNSNTCINHGNLINSRGNSGLTQLSPATLTAANTTQQLRCPVLHNTLAKTTLFSQEQPQIQQAGEFNSNTCINHGNLINSRGNSGLTQLSPATLTAANTTQQLRCPVLHNTLAKTTLFSQEQTQIQQDREFNSNTCINLGNLINSPDNSGLTQLSPAILTAANATQQLSSPVLHATPAKTTLFCQKQTQIQQVREVKSNTCISHCNIINSPSNSGLTQSSPAIVNATKTVQQLSSPPPETIKYTIIAEGTGNSNAEPIEIQLAEDDGALNLNSSADSGRLEICLAPTESMQTKTECQTLLTEEAITPNTLLATTPIKQKNIIEKPTLPASTNSCQDSQTFGNIPQQTLIKNRRRLSNDTPKTTKIKNKIIKNDMNSQALQIQSPNSSNLSTEDEENGTVLIGPNKTPVSKKLYNSMEWTSASMATRKLLMAIFNRDVLATHSLTGKASPAFRGLDKPVKQMLNPLIIADIMHEVTTKCNVSEKEVRTAITTKCADENKMMKLQRSKQAYTAEKDKEN